MTRWTKKTLWISGALLVLLTALIVAAIAFSGGGDPREKDLELEMPREYLYGTETATNGMELHYLRTRPSNVQPVTVNTNVTIAPYYGVNGGFFYEKSLLSIALANGIPANEVEGQYGSGAFNAKFPRGTLVWDGSLDQLSVQVARQASELIVTDRSKSWAQGGISMSLDRDDLWLERIESEHAPLPIDLCLRSAAAYDIEGNLFLIVSTTRGTLADFRAAIIERIGEGRLVNGIFLDGDGSSQLRSREVKLSGDGRPVVQMLRLIK
ncbi:hypothetical protein [Cohnella lupini]|uniref:Phosphodiester glycosidase domain-containing protein n=1 Tax=Cohnella lupini TaxID=1294267 RepID=A0A3D9IQ18_9BACL|nr:hypothetical protein [Cohnella lupini]RED63176.1 hypothetical protein DFP95_104170 [Cohnella lupini]